MLFQQLFCVIIFFGCQWGWIHKLAHFFWFWADCEKHTYCCIFPTFKITWTKGFENHLRPASHSCASSPSIYCHLVFIPLSQFISCILYRSYIRCHAKCDTWSLYSRKIAVSCQFTSSLAVWDGGRKGRASGIGPILLLHLWWRGGACPQPDSKKQKSPQLEHFLSQHLLWIQVKQLSTHETWFYLFLFFFFKVVMSHV